MDQARACDILGNRRYEAAIDQLGEIARAGTTNGRGAALRALGRIGSAAALAQILESAPHFDKGWHWGVASALEGCGCKIRKDNVDPRGIKSPDYLYQLPRESEWRKL